MKNRRKSSGQKIIKKHQKGFSLVEVLVASTVLAVSVVGVSTLQNTVMQQTRQNNDRAFATQKATQMFEELRNFVQANREEPLKSLQDYFSNGVNEFVPTLTTEKRIDPSAPNNRRQDQYLAPNDILSGNTMMDTSGVGQWKYVRQVLVEPVPSDPDARHVTVKVWYANASNQPVNEELPLAVITGILKTNIDQTPPTEVYDMYIMALENAPGWWVDVSTLRPIFDRTIDDLGSRNPGLEVRKHYISRFGFGRDPYYTPYVNTAADARDTRFPFTYFYPGNIADSTDSADKRVTEVYVDSLMRGRKRNDNSSEKFNIFKATDSIRPNPDNDKNPADTIPNELYRPYSMADQYNQSMRYPEEMAMYKRLNAQQKASPKSDGKDMEPSLRLLLDGMSTDPDSFRSSMLINLHGELIPLPPVRNYADPAKIPCDESFDKLKANLVDNTNLDNPCVDPSKSFTSTGPTDRKSEYRYRNMRVVTHPEKIAYGNGDTVKLRVYAYQTLPLGQQQLSSTIDPIADSVEKISLFIPTNGQGVDPRDTSKTGYLDNPSFDPTLATGNIENALTFSKIVGSDTIAYEKERSTGPINSNRRFTALTNQDEIVLGANLANINQGLPTAPIDLQAQNNKVQLIQLNQNFNSTATVDSGKLTTAFDHNNPTASQRKRIYMRVKSGSIDATEEARLKDLIGSLIVIDAQRPNGGTVPATRETARVKGVRVNQNNENTALENGYVEFELYEDLKNPHTTSSFVAKHRDYDIQTSTLSPHGVATPGIRVNLYDTMSRHPKNGTGGLYHNTISDTRRLYRQEYIPMPVTSADATTYNIDLLNGTNSGNNVKNTARWVVELDLGNPGLSGLRNQRIAFETRIGRLDDSDGSAMGLNASDTRLLEQGLSADGDPYRPDDPSTGSVNENDTIQRRNLYNVSRTYTWTASSAATALTMVPLSERFQYMGDPRFNPYSDVRTSHGYNPYFVNSINTSGVGDFTTTGDDGYNVDFIRYSRLFVDGMMRSGSIYNSISGYSNYYYALGGDMGADSNNTLYNIHLQPFRENDDNGNASISSGEVADVGGGHKMKYVFSRRNSADADRWYGVAWQGDLFPDEEFLFWKFNGNLPTRGFAATHNNCVGTTANCNRQTTYWRGHGANAPLGLPENKRKNPGPQGAPTFMNGNMSGSGDNNFGHNSDDNARGKLTNVAGGNLNRAFNLSLEAEPKAARPFVLDQSANKPGLYTNTAFMKSFRNKLEVIDVNTGNAETTYQDDNIFYFKKNDTNQLVSSIVKLTRSGEGSGYMLVNGLSKTEESSETSVARFSIAGMLQAYMNGGDFAGAVGDEPSRTRPIPRVEITSPTPSDIFEDSSSIQVKFLTNWLRWDLEKYSPAYQATWRDIVKTQYIFKYSEDAGKTWRYLDNTPADPEGVYNPSKVYQDGVVSKFDVPGGMAGLEKTLNWNVSALKGTYLLRVECYRIEDLATVALKNGYSYHQVYVTFRRN